MRGARVGKEEIPDNVAAAKRSAYVMVGEAKREDTCSTRWRPVPAASFPRIRRKQAAWLAVLCSPIPACASISCDPVRLPLAHIHRNK